MANNTKKPTITQKQPNAAIQEFQYRRTKDVTRAMQQAGAAGQNRVWAGLKAAARARAAPTYGGVGTAGGAALRFFGYQGAGKWYDRFLGKAERQQQRDDDDDDEGGTTGAASPKLVSAIKEQGSTLRRINTKVNIIGTMIIDLKSDVFDIKSMLSPRKMVVKGKKGTADEGKIRNIQYDPLAPEGEQFRTTGGILSKKPGKNFMDPAMKEAALSTAKLALKEEREELIAKGVLRKSFEDPEEDTKDEVTNEEILEEIQGFGGMFKTLLNKFKKSSFFDFFSKLFGEIMMMGRAIAWLAGPAFALWLGVKIGKKIWDTVGVPVLDAVFALKEWWANLDILGGINNITEEMRNLFIKAGLKSDAEYAEMERKNAEAGRTRGAVQSQGMTMEKAIEQYKRLSEDKNASPTTRAAATRAYNSLIGGAPSSTGDTIVSLDPNEVARTPTAQQRRRARPKSKLGKKNNKEGKVPYNIAENSIGMNKSEWDVFRRTVGEIESGNDYSEVGGKNGNYDGRYQMGAIAKLEAARFLGIPSPGHSAKARQQFIENPDLQEKMFAAFTAANHKYFMRNSKEYRAMSKMERIRILGYAHNQGQPYTLNYLRTGKVGYDTFKTPGTKYSDALTENFNKTSPPPNSSITASLLNPRTSTSGSMIENATNSLFATLAAAGSMVVGGGSNGGRAPVILNNNTIAAMRPPVMRPMNSDASALSNDGSFVRYAGNAVVHPTTVA
jgi:hypothetical protein